MTFPCDYCRAPIHGTGYLGRPFPGKDAARYCCYGCLSLGEQNRLESSGVPSSGFRIDGHSLRLGIGLLVISQSMIFSLGINLEEQTSRLTKWVVQGTVLAGTLLVMALLGGPLFRNAYSEVRRGRLTIEALFLLTMAGAMTASMQSFLTGHGPIYFEVVSVLIVVYTLGKTIGARSRASALASTKIWSESMGTCRLIDEQGRDRLVDVTTVLPGDRIEIRPGETIAVDGILRSGTGFVSEAAIRGEPFAVVKRPGDTVLAGMASHDACFRIEATAPGTARQIDRLLQAVEDARQKPISMQAHADRLGRIFFPLIVLTALATFGIWSQIRDWQTGLLNAMSVLLVACPCALGLATPIVVWSALTRLAERGILARTGDMIERLAGITTVIFDKTGTLTEDRFALVDLATHVTGNERAILLGWLALVQEKSLHPMARPFADLPKPFAADALPQVENLRVIPGCGITAEIRESSLPQAPVHTVYIGRSEWIAEIDSNSDADLLEQLHTQDGHRVDCAIDGHRVAIAVIRERLRDTVPETLEIMQRMGLHVEVLTGDTADRANALDLPNAQGNLLPEDKRRRVAELQQANHSVLMIGDGINDSAALAEADLGIAISSGTDVANSAASASLYHHDLRVLAWAIALGREAQRVVRRNLLMAATYNLIGITLAAFGVLHPVTAALLMVVSSLLVAWSATRVGVSGELCGCESTPTDPTRSPVSETATATISSEVTGSWASWVHGIAFALQAIFVLLLLDLSRGPVIAGFIAVGFLLAWLWHRWKNVPHSLDMAYGMLTLGNLGMLAGWWADNGFTRFHDGGCCQCVEAMQEGVMKPWMWLGMLALANIAMIWLGRKSHPEIRYCRTAMFTGGNLGMVLGMWAGGWVANQGTWESVPWAATVSFVGMTIGMVGGMLLGSELTRRTIGWVIDLKTLPRYAIQTVLPFQAKNSLQK